MKKIGYLQSFPKKNVREKIIKYAAKNGFGAIQVIQEQVSDRSDWEERILGEEIFRLTAGDYFFIYNFNCLGRSMMIRLNVLGGIFERKVNLCVVEGNIILKKPLEFHELAKLCQKFIEEEQEIRSRRMKEVLKEKKRAGVKLGRPAGTGKGNLDERREEIKEMLDNGVTQKFIADKIGISQATLSYWIIKNKIKK